MTSSGGQLKQTRAEL